MPHGGQTAGLLYALDGPTLILCEPGGDVTAGSLGGLYHHDTRYLSEWTLRIDGSQMRLLTSHPVDHRTQLFYATNDEHASVPAQALTVRRLRTLRHGLNEVVDITNHLLRPVDLHVTVEMSADFASVFEVQRGHLETAGDWEAKAGDVVQFTYDHPRFHTTSEVRYSPAPETISEHVIDSHDVVRPPAPTIELAYAVHLEPNDTWHAEFEVALTREREHIGKAAHRLAGTPAASDRELETAWVTCATWPAVQQICARSLADLKALRLATQVDGRDVELPAAGIPWYLAIIARDTLWAAYASLAFTPDLAAGALLALSALQAEDFDPDHDAEPGKIPHELRFGKLTAIGEEPFSPYYGTVDATPLFIILASEHWRVTGSADLIQELRPNLLAALGWLDDYADLDGDGLLEYQRRAPRGARNHCWKDSEDAIRFADGELAEGAIAICEAQGYAYQARLRLAQIAAELWDDAPLAQRLRHDAQALFDHFNDAFWIDRRGGYYALALDGDKRQVDALTSNIGHLLWSGIVPPDRVDAIAAQLAAPAMSSGWGVRTMSTDDAGYNPISYHTGSVWPHDNAIVAAGLAAAGRREQACEIAISLFEAGERFEEFRLPEVYTGHAREQAAFPIWYPQAASPQGWAAGAPLMLVRTLLGLEFSGGQPRIDFAPTDPATPASLTETARPAASLPERLHDLAIHGLRSGGRELTIDVGGVRGEG